MSRPAEDAAGRGSRGHKVRRSLLHFPQNLESQPTTGLRGVKDAKGGKVVPAPPRLGGGTHHAGVGKADPCAGLLRVKLFIDFAHFGPGRWKVQVVGTECRGNREPRRTRSARRVHPGLASIHRVTGAILGSAIPAPSPPSSTSKKQRKESHELGPRPSLPSTT